MEKPYLQKCKPKNQLGKPVYKKTISYKEKVVTLSFSYNFNVVLSGLGLLLLTLDVSEVGDLLGEFGFQSSDAGEQK